MKYYRTKKDIAKLASEMASFTTRTDVSTTIAKKHNLRPLGLLGSFTKDAAWFSQGNLGSKDDQHRLSPDVYDFLVNEGAHQDAKSGHVVKVFGRMQAGRVVEVAVLNMSNLIDPHEVPALIAG